MKKVIIDKKLESDIAKYCETNELDINTFVNGLLNKAFMIEKYGEIPSCLVKNKVKEETSIENTEAKTNDTQVIEDSPKPKVTKRKIITY